MQPSNYFMGLKCLNKDFRLTLLLDTPCCVLGFYINFNENQMQYTGVIAARTRDIKLIISRFQMLASPTHPSRLTLKAYFFQSVTLRICQAISYITVINCNLYVWQFTSNSSGNETFIGNIQPTTAKGRRVFATLIQLKK